MLKLILTLGMRGDYNRLRRLALRCPLFRPLHFLYCVFHGSVLPLGATIGGPVRFPHEPTGVFLSTTCVIGRGCTIMQHVTIGSNFVTKINGGGGAPVLGDNVFVGAGAKIIGPVRIGNNVKIGAGAVVVTDVPDDVVVVMHKPRILVGGRDVTAE